MSRPTEFIFDSEQHRPIAASAPASRHRPHDYEDILASIDALPTLQRAEILTQLLRGFPSPRAACVVELPTGGSREMRSIRWATGSINLFPGEPTSLVVTNNFSEAIYNDSGQAAYALVPLHMDLR